MIRPSGRAYAAIIVGVAGLHCMFPLGIVALGLASAELSDIEAGAAPEAGRDYVRWARTIGWINVALTVVSVAIGALIAIGVSLR